MNDRATGDTQVTGASRLVTDYLTAYTSGNVAKALALLSDLIGHVAPIARGMHMLHQWADGDDVCSVYLFDIDAPAGPVSLLIGEWNTVRNGEVASFMAFDTGVFTSSGPPTARIVDPVCAVWLSSPPRQPRAGASVVINSAWQRPDSLVRCPALTNTSRTKRPPAIFERTHDT